MRKFTPKIPENRQIYLFPSPEKIDFYLRKNKDLFDKYHFKLFHRPYKLIRENCRNKLLQEAIDFSQSHKINFESNLKHNHHTIIQTGHQPTFFHPGIWIKNIFLNEILKSPPDNRKIGLNIILDNDHYREPSFNLPILFDSGFLKLEKINFLSKPTNLPFEESSLPSFGQIKEFNKNVITKIKSLKNKNIINNFIYFSKCLEKSRYLCQQGNDKNNLGEFLGVARRYFENDINPIYLELPFSKICDSDEFLSFFWEITQNIDLFSKIYNSKLDAYRKHHKIRNKVNPLPDLLIKDKLIELPFWVWKKGDIRKKLYILKEERSLFLYNEIYGKLICFGKNNPKIFSRLKNVLKKNQIKIRPKALMLTLYNRLFIADLFIHGIGGAKYDMVTDGIIKEFFKVEPPYFITISATLLLDLKSFYSSIGPSIPLLKKKLRDFNFNPENFIPNIGLLGNDKFGVRPLIKRKIELIKKIKVSAAPIEKKEISKEISQINHAIKEKLLPLKIELNEKLVIEEKKEKQAEIYNFREYPFCFFSAKELRNLLNF